MKHHRLTGIEVGSCHTERDAQLLECVALQSARKILDHSIIGSKATSRERPAGEARKTCLAGDFFHLDRRQSAAIAGADQRANTRSADDADRNILLFEYLQDTDMRDAASKATAERNTDGDILRSAGERLARKLSAESLDRPNNLPQMLHGETPPPGLFSARF